MLYGPAILKEETVSGIESLLRDTEHAVHEYHNGLSKMKKIKKLWDNRLNKFKNKNQLLTKQGSFLIINNCLKPTSGPGQGTHWMSSTIKHAFDTEGKLVRVLWHWNDSFNALSNAKLHVKLLHNFFNYMYDDAFKLSMIPEKPKLIKYQYKQKNCCDCDLYCCVSLNHCRKKEMLIGKKQLKMTEIIKWHVIKRC